MTRHLEITEHPDPSARAEIADPLLAYNVSLLGFADIRPLAILIHSDDGSKVVGGLWGRTSFQWLFIELLFVPDELRSQGLGARMLENAEAEAKRRACRGVWLDTFSTAAAHFHEKKGYKPFGVITDYPLGAARHFLSKLL